MTAAITAGRPIHTQGLRPFDPGRDLTALADLIEVGFAESLDRSGRRMVRGLRTLGRFGWMGGLLSKFILPPAANPQGFVWEEQGRVLGNASLLPVNEFPHRWVMANVAVLPEERGRGIGRTLVNASIEHAQERGAREIVLQVDQSNQAALKLYESLGFTASPSRTTWTGRVLTKELLGPMSPDVRTRRSGEWKPQWELARQVHPEGFVWPYPPSARYFRPRDWQQRLRLNVDRHWVWFDDGQLLGFVSLRWALEPGTMRMILVVEPESRGQIEHALITTAMHNLLPTRDSIILDYPTAGADETLKALGFSERRKLVWMRLKL